MSSADTHTFPHVWGPPPILTPPDTRYSDCYTWFWGSPAGFWMVLIFSSFRPPCTWGGTESEMTDSCSATCRCTCSRRHCGTWSTHVGPAASPSTLDTWNEFHPPASQDALSNSAFNLNRYQSALHWKEIDHLNVGDGSNEKGERIEVAISKRGDETNPLIK